jgi:signal transduction histidine kinase
VVVLRDITREVESERLKDDFITHVSHELRTPLTAIKGYNDLLRMTAANKLDERQLGFIETVDRNVADLLQLIQEMLDLSQINAGILGIDQEPINLSKLIDVEAEKWTEKMKERELTFIVSLPNEPVWVKGDWSRLSLVVHNLIRNAYDYTLPGGRIEVWLRQENSWGQMDVKDTGVGVAAEQQHFLFTRFFRAIHEESTYEVSGAGLGLYISKAIIEAHQGEIWMESKLNEGSTFSFALPSIKPELVKPENETVAYAKTE